ncbi:hypothetical protein [Brevibacterium sp.]|uniref:hypothetical protein n=1 Tax=Brevibacterium sp. TaxID=1701 RepID=UPI0028121C3A|nr:hypothetical protein [Brevibacterium sp.]
MPTRSAEFHAPPSCQSPRWVTVAAVLVAVGCIGFAAVNVVFEGLDHFADGPYAEYASGITVMNWLVIGLKVFGAVVALLSVSSQPVLLRPAVVGVLTWGAFTTLAVYVVGSMVEAIGMATGLLADADDIGLLDVGYMLFFLTLAAGFGVLAISHTRRHRLPRRIAVLGMFGPPVVLGGVLFVVPSLLAAIGVMPPL